MPKFSKREAIRFGWEVATRNLGFFVIAFILAGVVNGIPSRLQMWTKDSMPFLSFLFSLASLVLSQIVSIGFTRISLKLHDNEKPEYGELFDGFPLFFNYLLASIIYAVFVAVGFVLLIIPGIILAARLSLYGFLVVDKGLGPRAALTRSAELTRGAVWDLFVFGLLLFGIVVLGALALFVGLFVALPMILMASAYVYRKLLAQAEGSAGTPAPTPVPTTLP